jgi:hypothetical protein
MLMVEWTLFGKDRRIIRFVRLIGDIPYVIKKVNITKKPALTKVKYGDKTFLFNINKPVYRSRNTYYYYIDIDGEQLYFGKTTQKISSRMLDSILSKEIIKQLVAGLENPQFMVLFVYVIIGLAIGLPFGFILAGFVG